MYACISYRHKARGHVGSTHPARRFCPSALLKIEVSHTNISDSVTVCLCGIANEDSEHFLLHCPLFEEAQRDPLVSLSNISELDIAIANRMIMEAMVNYIEAIRRLD